MESFLRDIKYSLRMFRQSTGFTLTAIAALALGVGTNTAVFSVVNAVLLRPIAAPDPDRVVSFLSIDRKGTGLFASDIKFNLWREQTTVFRDISGYKTGWFNLTGVDRPQRADAAFVTEDYFRLFGIAMSNGRAFTSEEERPGATNVVILGDGFWKRVFGGDPRMVGKSILLSGESYRVVGILPAGTQTEAPHPPDVWLPFPIDPNSVNQVHYFRAMGRLRPGVTLAMANARLQLATLEFRRRYPKGISTSRGDVFRVEPMRDVLVKDARKTLITLAGAVSLVLLIACGNVASLLLARASAREREIAVRVAVGAGRRSIVRQLLTESGLLAIAGGVAGLGLGFAGIHAVLAQGPANIPRIGMDGSRVTLDWRVFLFTAIVTLVTTLLFGLIPALQTARVDLHTGLKEGGRTGAAFRQSKARSLLVIGQISLALLSVIGAALLIRTLIALRSVNPGFDPRNVVSTMVTMDPRMVKASSIDQIGEDIFRRLRSIPGVEGAALTGLLPLEGNFNSLTITIVGRPLDRGVSHGNSRWMTVSPGYFDVLKIPLIRGRGFTDGDRQDAPSVAIINQAMARQFWPGGDPLRDRLVIGKDLGQDFGEPERQVVGIVGDVHEDALNGAPVPAVFVPASQRRHNNTAKEPWNMWVVIRTQGPSGPLHPAIERELRQATGGLPVTRLRSMEEVLDRSTATQNFNMILMSIFGGCSLLLAAIGISGLLAHSVAQRSREMGIRMALGAKPSDVRAMVVSQGMRLVWIGAGIGIAAAFGLTRFIESFLFGVKALDPLVFITVPILLAAVALVAVWAPALRASRVDPAEALRCE